MFESNGGYGLQIYKPVDATNLVGSFLFTNCYWENNTDYAIHVSGESTQRPVYITFEHPHINSSANKAINIVQGTSININNPYFDGSPNTSGFFTVGIDITAVGLKGYEGAIGITGLLVSG